MAASDSNTTTDELEFSNSHESFMDLFYESSSFEEPLAIGNNIQPYQFEPSDESCPKHLGDRFNKTRIL